MGKKSINPSLPPLYFHESAPLPTNSKVESSNTAASFQTLPPEIVQHCLVNFCDWGDLAKLSTVQSSWRNLVRDAATYGGDKAEWELAEALLNGTNGLERNPNMAVRYLTELAGVDVDEHENRDDAGNKCSQEVENEKKKEPFSPAMRKLATCYLTGDGVEANTSTGIRWLETAHDMGKDVDAAHELALIYETGKHGIDIDVVLAADFFYKAAQGGHVEAMAEYAMCCELGLGGREQNDEEALEWYIKAANKGHATANFSVGEAYEEAKGVPQSDEEACLWYYKAAVLGDEDSKRALRRLRDIARIVLPGVGILLDA